MCIVQRAIVSIHPSNKYHLLSEPDTILGPGIPKDTTVLALVKPDSWRQAARGQQRWRPLKPGDSGRWPLSREWSGRVRGRSMQPSGGGLLGAKHAGSPGLSDHTHRLSFLGCVCKAESLEHMVWGMRFCSALSFCTCRNQSTGKTGICSRSL